MMDNEDIAVVGLFIFMLIINILIVFVLLGLAYDLSDKVTMLEKANTELKQKNIELKWELDQVDEMICTNEELNYE